MSARLDAIEAHAGECYEVASLNSPLDHLSRDALALVAALRAVLALHKVGDGYSQGYTDHCYGYIEPFCAGCEASEEYAVEWPCPTVRAAALDGVA